MQFTCINVSFMRKSTRKCGIMHIWQLKVQQLLGPYFSPRPLAYRAMYLQIKPSEQIRPLIFSEKVKETCICQNGQNLSYWNKYFVMYPHKCKLKNLKESNKKSGKMHIWKLKCPEMDIGPQLILSCFPHSTPLHYISKISGKNS